MTHHARSLVTGCALALAGAATVTALAGPAAATTTPDVQTIKYCETATFWQNYDSGTGHPYGALADKNEGETVGHTVGVHQVIGGYAAAYNWGLGVWGYIQDSCITHVPHQP